MSKCASMTEDGAIGFGRQFNCYLRGSQRQTFTLPLAGLYHHLTTRTVLVYKETTDVVLAQEDGVSGFFFLQTYSLLETSILFT